MPVAPLPVAPASGPLRLPHLEVAVPDAKLAVSEACADIRVHLRIDIWIDTQQHLGRLTNLKDSPRRAHQAHQAHTRQTRSAAAQDNMQDTK
jgi:hypothetical protein